MELLVLITYSFLLLKSIHFIFHPFSFLSIWFLAYPFRFYLFRRFFRFLLIHTVFTILINKEGHLAGILVCLDLIKNRLSIEQFAKKRNIEFIHAIFTIFTYSHGFYDFYLFTRFLLIHTVFTIFTLSSNFSLLSTSSFSCLTSPTCLMQYSNMTFMAWLLFFIPISFLKVLNISRMS